MSEKTNNMIYLLWTMDEKINIGDSMNKIEKHMRDQDLDIAALRRELEDLKRQRPMSEAPRDGSFIVGKLKTRIKLSKFDVERVCIKWVGEITSIGKWIAQGGQEFDHSDFASWSYTLPLPATGGTET
jgi:hypothetical protein